MFAAIVGMAIAAKFMIIARLIKWVVDALNWVKGFIPGLAKTAETVTEGAEVAAGTAKTGEALTEGAEAAAGTAKTGEALAEGAQTAAGVSKTAEAGQGLAEGLQLAEGGTKGLVTATRTSQAVVPVAEAATGTAKATEAIIEGAEVASGGAKVAEVVSGAAEATSMASKAANVFTKVAPGLKVLGKVAGPLAAVTGAVSGILEDDGSGRGVVERGLLGVATGGSNTGSMFSSTLGIKKGSAGDEALGIAGAAGSGAMLGASIGSIVPVVGTAIGAAAGAIVGAGAEIYKIFTSKDSALRKCLGGAWDWLTEKAGSAWSSITGTVSKAWDGLCEYAEPVWSGICDVASSAWGSICETVGGAWDSLKEACSPAWDGICETVSGAWIELKEACAPAWKGICDAASGAWDDLKALAGPAWEAISGIVETEWNKLKMALENKKSDARQKKFDKQFDEKANKIEDPVARIAELERLKGIQEMTLGGARTNLESSKKRQAKESWIESWGSGEGELQKGAQLDITRTTAQIAHYEDEINALKAAQAAQKAAGPGAASPDAKVAQAADEATTKMADQATKPGSIYVHDIHTEGYLASLAASMDVVARYLAPTAMASVGQLGAFAPKQAGEALGHASDQKAEEKKEPVTLASALIDAFSMVSPAAFLANKLINKGMANTNPLDYRDSMTPEALPGAGVDAAKGQASTMLTNHESVQSMIERDRLAKGGVGITPDMDKIQSYLTITQNNYFKDMVRLLGMVAANTERQSSSTVLGSARPSLPVKSSAGIKNLSNDLMHESWDLENGGHQPTTVTTEQRMA